MGAYYTKSKYVNNRKVKKLLTLKDGRLSALFNNSIEIYSKEKLDTVLIINSQNNSKLETFIQLNNGNLVVCSDITIDIIYLENNTYHIEQTITINKVSFKILESKNNLFSFDSDKITIYEKPQDEYYVKTIIKNYEITKYGNFWFVDACYIDNKEIMVVLGGGIKFLSIKNSKWIKEINNYYNFNTNREIICKLNKNLYLVCGNNKFFIVDILKHEINSVINL